MTMNSLTSPLPIYTHLASYEQHFPGPLLSLSMHISDSAGSFWLPHQNPCPPPSLLTKPIHPHLGLVSCRLLHYEHPPPHLPHPSIDPFIHPRLNSANSFRHTSYTPPHSHHLPPPLSITSALPTHPSPFWTQQALVLVQAALGGLPLEDWTLRGEQTSMLEVSARLLGCCAESLAVCGRGGGLACAVCLRLMRSVRLKMWMDTEVKKINKNKMKID